MKNKIIENLIQGEKLVVLNDGNKFFLDNDFWANMLKMTSKEFQEREDLSKEEISGYLYISQLTK